MNFLREVLHHQRLYAFLFLCTFASIEQHQSDNLIVLFSILLLQMLSIIFSFCINHLYFFCELCFYSIPIYLLGWFILHLSLFIRTIKALSYVMSVFFHFPTWLLTCINCSINLIFFPFASFTALSSPFIILASFSSRLTLPIFP